VFRRELLAIVRPDPDSGEGLRLLKGVEENSFVSSGLALDPATAKTYPIKNGYLDLLGHRVGASSPANLTNFLPGAGPLYEPLWRVRSLSFLTGEHFTNDRELEVIANLVRLNRGGRYLDLGCSASLYTRNLATRLKSRGDVVGIDISPSMLKEAARRTRKNETPPSLVRADAHNLPFADASFAGAVCGGSLNEFGDPARALRETRRVLVSGGRVAIMGLLKASSARGRFLQRFLSTGGGVRFFEPEEVTSLLDHAGFDPEPVEIRGLAFFAGATRR
jgi:SAM-dependent methyltransferase